MEGDRVMVGIEVEVEVRGGGVAGRVGGFDIEAVN